MKETVSSTFVRKKRMKKMLLRLMAAMMVLTGCGSKQSVGELSEIDLTAKTFSSDKVGIADEIESIEYIP